MTAIVLPEGSAAIAAEMGAIYAGLESNGEFDRLARVLNETESEALYAVLSYLTTSQRTTFREWLLDATCAKSVLDGKLLENAEPPLCAAALLLLFLNNEGGGLELDSFIKAVESGMTPLEFVGVCQRSPMDMINLYLLSFYGEKI